MLQLEIILRVPIQLLLISALKLVYGTESFHSLSVLRYKLSSDAHAERLVCVMILRSTPIRVVIAWITTLWPCCERHRLIVARRRIMLHALFGVEGCHGALNDATSPIRSCQVHGLAPVGAVSCVAGSCA